MYAVHIFCMGVFFCDLIVANYRVYETSLKYDIKYAVKAVNL